MKNNKKKPPILNSYLVDFNITLLIQEARNKKEAIKRAIQAIEEQKYILAKNLIKTNLYE